MTSSIGSGTTSTGFINSSATGTSSISGLVSGMDTATLISNLMSIAAQPQALLKTQLSNAQTKAAAYRDINTSFAALQTAASQLTGANLQSLRSASTTNSSVTATAAGTASVGNSVSFTVDKLAQAQTSISKTGWSSPTAAFTSNASGPAGPLTVLDSQGNPAGSIPIPSGGTLSDAAAAINASGLGLNATIVQVSSSDYRLQVTSAKSGAVNAFTLEGATDTTAGQAFTSTTTAQDAQITLTGGFQATSASNTFTGLMTGVNVTVSALSSTSTTVSVSEDDSAITSKVQDLVDAANAALSKISQYTDSSSGSTAPLKGDYSMISLSNSIIDAVTNAVGSTTAADAGLTVDRYGVIQFDSTAFSTKLQADPNWISTVFGGSNGDGADGIPGSYDDTLDVDGIGARLMQLAAQASDTTVGTLTTLASGADTTATDLTSQISDWDTRLQLQQQTLTAQFTAMETALGTLKSQSSWLTSQINSLPGNSSSSS
jgi:flagellar hook-associated protein 2